MLTKGYALVKTRRTSSEGLGEIIATLEDGTTVDYVAFNDSARLHHGLHRGRGEGDRRAPRGRAPHAPISTATPRAPASAAASTTRPA